MLISNNKQNLTEIATVEFCPKDPVSMGNKRMDSDFFGIKWICKDKLLDTSHFASELLGKKKYFV